MRERVSNGRNAAKEACLDELLLRLMVNLDFGGSFFNVAEHHVQVLVVRLEFTHRKQERHDCSWTLGQSWRRLARTCRVPTSSRSCRSLTRTRSCSESFTRSSGSFTVSSDSLPTPAAAAACAAFCVISTLLQQRLHFFPSSSKPALGDTRVCPRLGFEAFVASSVSSVEDRTTGPWHVKCARPCTRNEVFFFPYPWRAVAVGPSKGGVMGPPMAVGRRDHHVPVGT